MSKIEIKQNGTRFSAKPAPEAMVPDTAVLLGQLMVQQKLGNAETKKLLEEMRNLINGGI